MTMSKLKHTGEAVIIDIGEGKDIHPMNKVDVGRRLARLALDNDYHFDIASRSPHYKSMEKADAKIVLTFDHVDKGWRHSIAAPVGFAIAGEDKFVWATAKILNNRIEVSSDAVANPVAVRYAGRITQYAICSMAVTSTDPVSYRRLARRDGRQAIERS